MVNRYGNDILILTNLSDKRITIPAGERYRIEKTFLEMRKIYFRAYDAFTPTKELKINNNLAAFVSASPISMSHVLYVETGWLCTMLEIPVRQ